MLEGDITNANTKTKIANVASAFFIFASQVSYGDTVGISVMDGVEVAIGV